MAEESNTTTAPRFRIADLVDKLRDAGVNREILTFLFECIDQEKSETIAKAARLYYNFSGDEGPISPVDFSDQFNNMNRRMWGLVAAVSDVLGDRSDSVGPGVLQLVEDAAREMERLSEAFDAEHWLARHQEPQS
ncbi:hypothetical protein HUN39_17745 [Methylocystis sp. FS]|uniref:hypothetical protein n=1 Tax=Methylocystis silviterrae TaxID=2743612 RepID=UPI00158395F8|nr:hypothetical protein [Methylocystis silviterrae]NUJ81832.1 hypothetical protein [Methylocystis silviterrae]